VRIYLDASVIVSLLTDDALTHRASALVASGPATLLVSDFAAAEFASAISRRHRMGELTNAEAHEAFSVFDEWSALYGNRVQASPNDMHIAGVLVRRMELGLRTPDALHLAIARTQQAALASFDDRMIKAARALKQSVWSSAPN
jgi:predicted nucleic acid-binding protein